MIVGTPPARRRKGRRRDRLADVGRRLADETPHHVDAAGQPRKIAQAAID